MKTIPDKYLSIGLERVRSVAGIKFYENKCIGYPECRRAGEHQTHVWWDETLISDEMDLAVSWGNAKEVRRVYAPIRWWNFTFALYKTGYDFLKAIEYAEMHCFDTSGYPKNMAKQMGFPSYGKFLDTLHEYA